MIPYESLKDSNKVWFTELTEAARQVIESGWYVLGKEVSSFESEFSKLIGVGHTIGVASGLDALILSLSALDLPQGSEVIVPSNTYIATILAILRCGHRPVLVEPDPDTMNICPKNIEKTICEKTKAIMVVHLYGKACAMDQIMEIANSRGIPVIEDCAQSHGATLEGQQTGSFGAFGSFSFYPTKNLGAIGDGGAITCKRAEDSSTLHKLRNYGSSVKYHNDLVGFNSRLDELQAAFLRVKLKYLTESTEHKRKLAQIYHDNLPEWLQKPVVDDKYFDVYHIYAVRHSKRDRLLEFLGEQGIGTGIHYPIAPHHQKCMKGILEGSYPISESIHNSILSLPISYGHTKQDIETVCEVVCAFGKKQGL